MKTMIRLFLSLSIASTSWTGCSSDDPIIDPPDELDPATFMVANLTLVDINNAGNASDLEVRFDQPTSSDVSSFKIVIVPEASLSEVTLTSIESLTEDRFELVSNTGDITHNLKAATLDFTGSAISNDESYAAVVLSVGTFNEEEASVLSDPSATILMKFDIIVSTLVEGFEGNDAIWIDEDGNIYSSNFGNGFGTNVLKVTPSGTVSTFASGLNAPLGNAFDSKGNFYVSHDHAANNYSEGLITKIDASGNQSEVARLSGYPSGITVDESDNVYVSNYSLGVVNKISPDGSVSTFAEGAELAGGVGLAFDDSGNLILGNFTTGGVFSIGMNGSVTKIAQLETLGNSDFIIGYICYFESHVYATGISSDKIYKVSLNGDVEVFAGNGTRATVDGLALEASFSRPNGIGVDLTNRKLFISQYGTPGLRVIDLD